LLLRPSPDKALLSGQFWAGAYRYSTADPASGAALDGGNAGRPDRIKLNFGKDLHNLMSKTQIERFGVQQDDSIESE
jgi:hypothetical protein